MFVDRQKFNAAIRARRRESKRTRQIASVTDTLEALVFMGHAKKTSDGRYEKAERWDESGCAAWEALRP
jgi:hypothetical protein